MNFSIDEVESNLNSKLLEYKQACTSIQIEKKELITSRREISNFKQAQIILQNIAQTIQQSAHEHISRIVSQCLRVIFGNDAYRFSIEFERKRGKTEARLCFTKGKHEFDPKEDIGGSVLDVVSFALRISAIVMTQPRIRKLIIMDEPFKSLSASRKSRVGEMIERLAIELKVQFILITHDEELKIGKVIEL